MSTASSFDFHVSGVVHGGIYFHHGIRHPLAAPFFSFNVKVDHRVRQSAEDIENKKAFIFNGLRHNPTITSKLLRL